MLYFFDLFKPNVELFSIPVDVIHNAGVSRSFSQVVLVDTNSISPYNPTYVGLSEMPEYRMETSREDHRALVDSCLLIEDWLAPRIRQ